MPVNKDNYLKITGELKPKNVTLVAVSKTKPVTDILELYELGQRDFGENYVQELVDKYEQLPKDIRWHFIGHLQSNKVKYIASFVHLIHGVDSVKLLKEVNKQAGKLSKTLDVLLQVYIAQEESKFGLDAAELNELFSKDPAELSQVRIRGLMGMASFTDDTAQVQKEFKNLKQVFDQCQQQKANPDFQILSMGMSGDYELAMQEGSTMVRIGSLLFGERTKH